MIGHPSRVPGRREARREIKMKRLLLALGCMAAAAAGSAAAADLPIKMPSAYAPFFTWQGFYVGINAGYGFGHSSWADNVTLLSTGKFDVSGAMVGGTMGYNVQLGGWVLGLEGDAGWSGVKGSTAINCPGGCQTTNEWLGTARGRVGYAFNGLLPYVTGGAAFGDVNASSPGGGTRADMGWGWTGGAGLEYAFAARWSAKVEYLYVDLGKTNCCGNPIDVTFTSNVVRGGVNYKF
jgi:outer membrane immunogenic protein